MNPSIIHREAERKSKCWLAEQYRSHGTAVPKFSDYDGTDYEKEVKDLAVNIFQYLPDDKKRGYVQTINLDWNGMLS